MTTIKLHYDGWLALPAALRRQLSLDTGDKLEVALSTLPSTTSQLPPC